MMRKRGLMPSTTSRRLHVIWFMVIYTHTCEITTNSNPYHQKICTFSIKYVISYLHDCMICTTSDPTRPHILLPDFHGEIWNLYIMTTICSRVFLMKVVKVRSTDHLEKKKYWIFFMFSSQQNPKLIWLSCKHAWIFFCWQYLN